jgi:hypothetical protein
MVVYIHIFSTSALVGGEWPASRPCRYTPGEKAPGSHWIGGWVDIKAFMVDVEKRKFLTLPGLKPWPLSLPARSQSLYWLRLHGSLYNVDDKMINQYGAVYGMRIGRGNRNTSIKPVPVPPYPP